MARDLKLDSSTLDLVVEDGDLAFVEDGAEVAQNWKLRILWVRGEWRYNVSLGIPWFSEMFKLSKSPVAKRRILIDETLKVPGVRSVVKLESETANHETTIDMTIDTVYNTREVVQI